MYKVLSTFTGAGGFDIGFHGDFNFLGKHFPRLNFETKASIDLNPDAVDTVKRNIKYFRGNQANQGNIITFDKATMPKHDYDILLGGFPCVTFSMSGNRLGVKDDINGKLYESFASYVEYFRPKVFIAENVKGMLSANKGQAVIEIEKRFKETGYKLHVYSVNFAQLGVPQQRERVLFVGVRDDIDIPFVAPRITHPTKDDFRTAGDAFGGVELARHNNELMNHQASTIAKIEAIPEGGNFKDLPPELAIKAKMSNIYRRLHRDKAAYTVLASGGGGTWGYHYDKPRTLTNRERARLQSFPDDLVFSGSTTEVRRQIGNAVPPVGIYPFAKQVQALLDGINAKVYENCIPEYDTKTKKFIAPTV